MKNPLIISSVLGNYIFTSWESDFRRQWIQRFRIWPKLSTPIAFMILGGDLDFSKVKGNLKVASVVLTIKLVILPLIMIPMIVMMGYRDADLLSRPAGIPDSGCGIQLYHGTTGRSGWTACRTAGGVLIGAFDLYVVCDDIDIADDGAPCGLVP